MRHQTVATDNPQTIAWLGDELIDWVSLKKYGAVATKIPGIQRGFGFPFNRAITSAAGQYAFVYDVLGTKGLLLKDGEVLREINRSYYRADTYEYPAAFATVDGITYLIHCSIGYSQLDFEDVETGELVTNIPGRNPSDVFHSRLEISPEGGFLMSKGWYWQPWDGVEVFDIRACLHNPLLLDDCQMAPESYTEIGSAGFISEETILLGASPGIAMDEDEPSSLPPSHVALWNFRTDKYSKAVAVREPFGNLFPIDAHRAWDLYQYPKIIDLDTGEVIDKLETLQTGLQCSSIIHHLQPLPTIAFNPRTKQVAVKMGGSVELLSVD